MSDETVTKLVIDSDTSGADQYSAAMDRVAASAEKGLGSNSALTLSIAGVGIGLAAAVGAIKEGVSYIADFNKQLADMAAVADRVGLSLKDFQAVQFGGQISGLSDQNINQGLEKSAQLLNDAQRNANSLSKLFDQNGVSIRNSNGALIAENQLLGIAADLVAKARSPQDAVAIAQMLGFTKEWVPLLEQGSGAMSALGDAATKAGAVIDDETVKRATQFDQEWRKSSVEFSTYMRSSLAGLLPIVDDLIKGAHDFVASIDRGKIQQHADEALKQIEGATGLPEGGGLKIAITPATETALKDFQSASVFSLDFWYAAGRALASSIQVLGPGEAKFAGGTDPLVDATGHPYSGGNPLVGGYFSSVAASTKSFDSSLSTLRFGAGTNIPGKDTGGDAVDRAINQLDKHTKLQLADADAVGLGDAALARFRAEATETAAVQANGGKETEAQAKRFAELKDAAAAAAGALAKAKVESQIDFNSKTAFLSQGDVAIANQLKGIYGNDVPAALNSTYAAAIRVNDAFKGISSAIETNLTSGLTDIVSGTKSVSQGFTDMGNAIVKALDQALIKMLIVEPIMRSLQGIAGGFLGGSGPITLGGPSGPTPFPSAHGNLFDHGSVMAFAAGGVVSSPTLAPMALFGEAGPEAIVPLKRGADGNLGVASSGGGGGGVSFGDINISVPQGTSPDNAAAIGMAVKSSMMQVIDERLAYQMRSRGLLNSGL